MCHVTQNVQVWLLVNGISNMAKFAMNKYNQIDAFYINSFINNYSHWASDNFILILFSCTEY